MLKNKVLLLGAGTMALIGAVAGTAIMASAQSATATPVIQGTSTSSVDTPESANDPADTDTGPENHGHAPLGGDGVVTSVSGTNIVMGEESDEGGASYTIDASHATITNNGAAATIADIKAGSKIFVQGTVTGTNVVATSVSLGHGKGGHENEANDSDGSAGSEANETGSTSDASDQ